LLVTRLETNGVTAHIAHIGRSERVMPGWSCWVSDLTM
jgi:hypothetical protein